MTGFFFEEWPNGLGPMIVQVGLLVGGSALGIRLVDDVKRARAAIRARRTRFLR